MAKPCVLLIEDDRAVRQTLADALELDGYEVITAEQGRQALTALAERRPDAIILDLMMPAMDGWEFRRLQRELHGDIPVLVVSASSDPRLDELSADAFLTKPFDLETFFVVVRGLLRGSGDEIAS